MTRKDAQCALYVLQMYKIVCCAGPASMDTTVVGVLSHCCNHIPPCGHYHASGHHQQGWGQAGVPARATECSVIRIRSE